MSVVAFIIGIFLLHSLGLEHHRSRQLTGRVHEGVAPSDRQPERVDVVVNEDTVGPVCDSASSKGNAVSPISFLNSLLFSRIKLGDGACVFIGDHDVVVNMGFRHGLEFDEGTNIKEMIRRIIYHVITGECYESRRSSRHEVNLGNECCPLMCTIVAAESSSSVELCIQFVHHILSYRGRAAHLTLDKLRLIVESLGHKDISSRKKMLDF